MATTLITGANGAVSSALLKSLAEVPGVEPRALVRDPTRLPAGHGLEVAVGDLERPDSLADAFSGVETVFLLTPMGPHAPHLSSNAVWAARQAGVRHIVRLSAVGAAHDAPTRNGRLHALSDAELRASGIAWTILKPHFFMQNLLGSVTWDAVYFGVGEGRLGMIDVGDIGAFGARVVADPAGHEGKTYTLTGPASVSMHDVAQAAGEALGTGVKYQPIPPEQAYRFMIDAGLPEWNAAVGGIEYGEAYARGWGDFTTDDFPSVVGRTARSIGEFARDHAASLTAS